MSTKCDGCAGKGTWFSPMRGDVECDWCHGEGKLCSCLSMTQNGTECWQCGLWRAPNFEAEDTDPTWMDGDDGFKILKDNDAKQWQRQNTPPYPMYPMDFMMYATDKPCGFTWRKQEMPEAFLGT